MDGECLNFWNTITLEEEPFLILNKTESFFRKNKGTFMAIYGAYCQENGRFYIGSSSDMRHRLNDHTRKLRKNIHENEHFQNTYNKYGKESFSWYVLVRVDFEEHLFPIEQIFLDVLSPFGTCGFNISPTAGSLRGLKRSIPSLQAKRGTAEPMRIRDPEGTIHEFFESFKDFASKHNISERGVCDVINKKRKGHRGWTLPTTEFKNPPILYSPAEGEVKVRVIKDFADKYKIPRARVREIIQGTRDIWNGWTLKGAVVIEKPKPIIQSPSGEIYEIENKKEFALRHNLNYFSLWNLLNRRVSSHKGWIRLR
jgi:group I intron endonuclease